MLDYLVAVRSTFLKSQAVSWEVVTEISYCPNHLLNPQTDILQHLSAVFGITAFNKPYSRMQQTTAVTQV